MKRVMEYDWDSSEDWKSYKKRFEVTDEQGLEKLKTRFLKQKGIESNNNNNNNNNNSNDGVIQWPPKVDEKAFDRLFLEVDKKDDWQCKECTFQNEYTGGNSCSICGTVNKEINVGWRVPLDLRQLQWISSQTNYPLIYSMKTLEEVKNNKKEFSFCTTFNPQIIQVNDTKKNFVHLFFFLTSLFSSTTVTAMCDSRIFSNDHNYLGNIYHCYQTS